MLKYLTVKYVILVKHIICDPMDGSPPGPSVHGILQARILVWVTIHFSRISSWSKGSNQGLLHCRQILYCLILEGSSKYIHIKEIQPVHPKGDQSWVFIGRTYAEAETPILCPPHGKSWLIGKDPDAGRDCGQEEKGMTEDEMAGWHHRLDGHEFE